MNTITSQGLTTSFTNFIAGIIALMNDFSSPSNFHQSSRINSSSIGTASNKSRKNFFKKTPLIPAGIAIVVVVIIAIVAITNITGANNNSVSSSVLSANNKTSSDRPIAQQQLNKNFSFPLMDSSGKEVSKLKYEVQSAELRDEIIVKGQRASAVKGRVFLIVNLKITNTYNQSVQLNTKDYVRLIVDGSPEKLAAEIHNDPVDVQAISTKYTRLGFPIDTNVTGLTLQIGEINGKKETIKLKLQ